VKVIVCDDMSTQLTNEEKEYYYTSPLKQALILRAVSLDLRLPGSKDIPTLRTFKE